MSVSCASVAALPAPPTGGTRRNTSDLPSWCRPIAGWWTAE